MEIIKNIDDKIKILFLKSNTHWGGPWFSFNFKDTTIDEILNNSFGKAGHPIPMICLYKMDVIIVDNNDLINVDIINYNIHTTQQCANNYKKYMKNIYKLKDVPFNKYNIIYTEDEIIPKNIIDNYKNILFIFNASEHYFNKKNYDLLINHTQMAFPHCLNTFNKYITNNRKSIYIEYRTACNLDYLEKLNNNIELDLIYNKNMCQINPWNMEIPDNCSLYWKKLGICKYFVQIETFSKLRLGQSIINAACLKLINIGYCGEKCNKNLIHPLCRVNTITEVINIIKKIENDHDLYEKIIEYQTNELIKLNNLFTDKLLNAYLIKTKY
jgi:hypothetical protein